MNQRLAQLNLIGVVLLLLLCVGQWRENRRLNLEADELIRHQLEQTRKIQSQEHKLANLGEDLDAFRGKLDRQQNNERKVRTAEKQSQQLAAERDKLKAGLSNWTDAASIRDVRLAEANARIEKLSLDLNTAILKFNQLTTNYNAVVAQLHTLQKQAKATGTNGPTP